MDDMPTKEDFREKGDAPRNSVSRSQDMCGHDAIYNEQGSHEGENAPVFNGDGSSQSKPVEKNRKEQSKWLSGKKKVLVVVIVIALCLFPLLHMIFTDSEDSYIVVTLKDPKLDHDTYYDGLVTIEESYEGNNVMYHLTYAGPDEFCKWYVYCNEDTVKIISSTGLVDRDFMMIGSGTHITVSGDVLHVGSYRLKLVTENHVYSGEEILIDGKVITDYTWPFIGQGDVSVMNHIQLTYDFKDYRAYAVNNSLERDDYMSISKYAVVDPSGVIDDLVGSLSSEFNKHYPFQDAHSAWFANYLLAFVQKCIEYPQWRAQPDEYIYGISDYFAYPLETLFRNVGDCEDTSILLSAMYDSAGYDSAITLLYSRSSNGGSIIGHSSSAVVIDKIVSRYNINRADFREALIQSENGKSYYLCETAVSYQLSVGFIQSMYLDNNLRINVLYPITVNDD